MVELVIAPAWSTSNEAHFLILASALTMLGSGDNGALSALPLFDVLLVCFAKSPTDECLPNLDDRFYSSMPFGGMTLHELGDHP